MAPRGKFKLNKRTVGMIAKRDPLLARAVDAAAGDIADKSGPTATVDTYTTDRHVAGVVVGATDQAKNGVATKAAQQTVADNAGKPFVSRAQWRFGFRNQASQAAGRARRSPSYRSLPERAPKRSGGRRG